jgi:nucleotide-binding universal stress UspA family protein
MQPFTLRNILVATDFSDLSLLALSHAVLWSQRFGAHLLVLHADEVLPVFDCGYFSTYNPEVVQALADAAAEQLKKCVQECVPPSVPVTSELMTGPPADVIEARVAQKGIELVVLGTHGRGGFSRLLLGSVAERVLRMARHPTLVVRQLLAGREPPLASLRSCPHVSHVLCPVNYTEVARVAFDHAAGVARAFGAPMTAVSIVEPDGGKPPDLQAEEKRLHAWLEPDDSLPCEVRTVVGHGDPAEQVVSLAQETQADLVVIGAQHRRFVDATVLGVTTVRVTRHAPCPVLVVPRVCEAG